MKRAASVVYCTALLIFSHALKAEDLPYVSASWGSYRVKSVAPIPSEVANETQAKALAREAAIVRGQNALLTYVLTEKTRSKKTLAEAEIPSLEIQKKIRGTIQGAEVIRTEWTNKECIVILKLSKSPINTLRRQN